MSNCDNLLFLFLVSATCMFPCGGCEKECKPGADTRCLHLLLSTWILKHPLMNLQFTISATLAGHQFPEIFFCLPNPTSPYLCWSHEKAPLHPAFL